jgi:hypothetical protein
MPWSVDEEAIRPPKPGEEPRIFQLDLHHPPMREIPHQEFPRVVYKYPNRPFTTIVHRNAKHEVVDEEQVPTEHLSRAVKDQAELEQALKEGWLLKPYIPPAPPKPEVDLYDLKHEKKGR